MKIFKTFILPNILLIAAFLVLVLKIGAPFHKLISLAFFAASFLRLAITVRRQKKYRDYKPKLLETLRPYRLHIAAAVVVAIIFYAGKVLIPVEDSFLTQMPSEKIELEIMSDYGTLGGLQRQCDDFFNDMQTGLWAVIDRPLRSDEIEELRLQRRLFSDMFLEYGFFKEKYKGYYLVDYVSHPHIHGNAFFIAFSAFVGGYEASLKAVRIVGGNSVDETILNEDDSDAAFPKDSYYYIKQQLTSPENLLRLSVGRAYLSIIKKDITFETAAIERLEKRLAQIDELFGRDMSILITNPVEMLERSSFESWLPAQKKIAVMMGRISPTNRPYYITPEIIKDITAKLEPGDIIITRRKWHLSNAGIPGFWTHSLLYTGTAAQINECFADAALQPNVFEYICGLYPNSRLADTDASGKPLCCVEAVEQGVVQHPLETALSADYAAVLRPKASKADKFKAVCAALSFVGRPYDYNFDFATDNSLVCSEVVCKAYAGSVPIEPQKQNGRLLLSPNAIARYFDDTADSPDCGLEFVLFLDFADGKTAEASAEQFRSSWNRPKWDILLE